MRRFVSLLLVMLLAILTVGCKDEAEEPMMLTALTPELEVTPYISAKSLLLSGFGVDSIDSMTLNMLYQLSCDGSTAVIELMYEQTPELVHVAFSPKKMDGYENNLGYSEAYYSFEDLVSYQLMDDGWHGSGISDSDVEGFRTMTQTFSTLNEIVHLPTKSQVENDYIVQGTLTTDFVELLFGDVPFDIEEAELNAYCTYDVDTLRLRNIFFEVLNGKDFMILDIDIVSINGTILELPFELGDVLLDELVEPTEEVTDDTWVNGSWLQGDEKFLAYEYFNIDYVREAEFNEWIRSVYGDIPDGVVYMARYYFNSCSREGFIRMLETSKPTIGEEYPAAVLVCSIIDVPLESLWINGFMNVEDVQSNCILYGIALK